MHKMLDQIAHKDNYVCYINRIPIVYLKYISKTYLPLVKDFKDRTNQPWHPDRTKKKQKTE